jgi:hypothetical protein
MTSTLEKRGQTLASRLAARCAADGEFSLAARYWTGSLGIDLGGQTVAFALTDGKIEAVDGAAVREYHVGLAAPREVWDKVLAPVPPPFFNDIMPARAFGLRVSGDEETLWQYYPAVRRLIDLLREEVADAAAV